MSVFRKSMKQMDPGPKPEMSERPGAPFTCLSSVGIIRPLLADR